MNEYEVKWIIEIQADTPRAAAQRAATIMRDPRSWATVFLVKAEDGESTIVDLLEMETQCNVETE